MTAIACRKARGCTSAVSGASSADVSSVDALFDQYDLDRSGQMEVAELRKMLVQLMHSAQQRAKVDGNAKEKVAALRKRAHNASTAAKAAAAATAARPPQRPQPPQQPRRPKKIFWFRTFLDRRLGL